MTIDDLLDRVRARGGEVRLVGAALQYRPATALTERELRWLRRHEGQAISALAMPDVDDRDAFVLWLRRCFGGAYLPIGDAGPDTPAWARTAAETR